MECEMDIKYENYLISDDRIKISEYESTFYFHIYASHSQRKIKELYEKGTLPEKGLVLWC